MYTQITDPQTDTLHLIHSAKGKNIIQGYETYLNGGSNKTLDKLQKQLKKAQQKVSQIKNKINNYQLGGTDPSVASVIREPPVAPVTSKPHVAPVTSEPPPTVYIPKQPAAPRTDLHTYLNSPAGKALIKSLNLMKSREERNKFPGSPPVSSEHAVTPKNLNQFDSDE